jgi:transposase
MLGSFVAVGIDSSDAHHDVCLLGPDAETESPLRIANDWAGFQQLLAVLQARWPQLSWCFALENPKSLLGQFLLQAGYPLYAPNPLAVARTRQSLAVSGAKSDAGDARVLARMLRERDERRLQPIMPNSPEGTLVSGLVEQRRELVTEKTRLHNQLVALLKSFYPRALELFSDLDQPLTRAFLGAFPTPSALQRASLPQWQKLFVGKRYPRPRQIPQLWEQATAPQVPVAPVVEALGERQLRRLLRLLEVVLEELSQVEAALAEAFAAHPDAEFFRSLPGAAAVLAPSLLALVGDNRERWQEWRQLATYAGTAPITKQSGRSRSVSMRFHCQREARNILYLYAGCSLRQCPWAESFYQQQRRAGKTHGAALRSLANKWLRILYRMWQERQPYDELTYLAALRRRQAPKSAKSVALAS